MVRSTSPLGVLDLLCLAIKVEGSRLSSCSILVLSEKGICSEGGLDSMADKFNCLLVGESG